MYDFDVQQGLGTTELETQNLGFQALKVLFYGLMVVQCHQIDDEGLLFLLLFSNMCVVLYFRHKDK